MSITELASGFTLADLGIDPDVSNKCPDCGIDYQAGQEEGDIICACDYLKEVSKFQTLVDEMGGCSFIDTAGSLFESVALSIVNPFVIPFQTLIPSIHSRCDCGLGDARGECQVVSTFHEILRFIEKMIQHADSQNIYPDFDGIAKLLVLVTNQVSLFTHRTEGIDDCTSDLLEGFLCDCENDYRTQDLAMALRRG